MASQTLVDHLLQYSVRRGEFILKSGRRSEWFVDSKQTMCRPDGLLAVSAEALKIIPDDVTAIGGLTMGADPVSFGIAAVAASRGRELRSFSIRKDSKDHGVTGRLAGALLPGDRVVIAEDTVTRGSSLLEAAAVVRDLGAEPVLAMAIVDRGGTCEAMAAEQGIPFVALVSAPDLGFGFGD